MSLHLENLDDEGIRSLMKEELESDLKSNRVYYSNRILPNTKEKYVELLIKAIEEGDSSTLAQSIRMSRILRTQETYRKKNGGIATRNIPKNAHFTLAEGEFNRFYLRAISRKAIEKDCKIQAYRAKPVKSQRSRSADLIGKELDPEALLRDLRDSIGKNPLLALPGGPNSGISGRIVCS